MATLTQQQLESNIQAMEKQGAPQGDIQAYLNSLKGPQAPSNFGAPAQPTEKKDGFFKTLVKAPLESLLVKPIVRTAQAVEGVGREVLGLGSEEGRRGYEERISKDTKVPIPLLGDIKVEPVKSGFAGVKQSLGEGLEAGSYLVGGGAAKGVAHGAVRSTLGRGIVQGAKVGAKSGAIYGVGAGMQEDKDLGGIVGSGLTGATIGGVAGGVLGGAFTGARHALLGKQSTAEEAAKAGGRIFQASSRQPSAQKYIEKTAPKILSKIDTRGVSTYDDLSRTLESSIDRGLSEVDDALKVSSQKLPIEKLNRVVEATSEAGRKTKATQNFVKEALTDMEELFTKTRNPAEKLRIKALAQQARTEGLSPFEINKLAREYGTTFKKKAFGAQGPLTSVNAVTYENTRKGLKETARSLFEGDALKNLDMEVSDMIRLKTMTDAMKGKITALENRVKDRNVVEKLFRGVANVADVATFGGPKAFITKLFFPSNVGQKTLNSIDLQNELVKNLRIIRNLEHASDSTVITALRNLAVSSGLIKPTSNFGRVATPKLGSAVVDKSVAKIPTARYTGGMKAPIEKPTVSQMKNAAANLGKSPTVRQMREATASIPAKTKRPAVPKVEKPKFEITSEKGYKNAPRALQDLIDDVVDQPRNIGRDPQEVAKRAVNDVLDDPQMSAWFKKSYAGNQFNLRQDIEEYITNKEGYLDDLRVAEGIRLLAPKIKPLAQAVKGVKEVKGFFKVGELKEIDQFKTFAIWKNNKLQGHFVGDKESVNKFVKEKGYGWQYNKMAD